MAQTPSISHSQRVRFYGPPGAGNFTTVTTPWGIRVRVHPLVAGRFLRACDRAKAASSWTPKRIDDYAPRPIRGSSSWSLHSWPLAWDFFATGPGVPPPGGVWNPHNGVPEAFGRAFEAEGFHWGKDWSRKDVPHIEWAGSPPGDNYISEELDMGAVEDINKHNDLNTLKLLIETRRQSAALATHVTKVTKSDIAKSQAAAQEAEDNILAYLRSLEQ